MTKKVKQLEVEKFDFKTIDSKEAAFKKCGINIGILESIGALIPDERLRNAQVSSFILMVGFKAINEDWIPDYSDKSQARYYPWPLVSSRGLDFSTFALLLRLCVCVCRFLPLHKFI